MLAGRSVIHEGTNRAGQDFKCHATSFFNLKYKDIIKMNPTLMVFIQEIIYLG